MGEAKSPDDVSLGLFDVFAHRRGLEVYLVGNQHWIVSHQGRHFDHLSILFRNMYV